MSKHTRGWQWLGTALVEDYGHRHVVLIAGKDGGLKTRGGDDRLRPLDPDEPIARLIKAAPKLLEATKDLMAHLDLHLRSMEAATKDFPGAQEGLSYISGAMSDSLKSARAAIAEATP